MSDETLRALERRWHETDAVDDEARWHAERVRHGALAQERLELAAWLGSPAAAQATGLRLERGLPDAVRYRRAPLRPGELMAWARGVDRFGVEVVRRALVADVGRAIGASRRRAGVRVPDGLRVARAWWEAAVAWLVSPTAPGAPGASERLDHLAEQLLPHGLDLRLFGETAPDAAVEAACAAAPLLREDLAPPCGAWWPDAIREHHGRKGGPPASSLVAIHAGIAAALIPWALGLRDPLLNLVTGGIDRVEVASPCPAAADAFTPTADPAVQRCGRCHVDVLDLSALPRLEAEARVAAGRAAGGLCVTLYRRPDGRVLTSDCVEGIEAPRPRLQTRGMAL